MLFLAQWFITFFYQPFLNLLVGVYWVLDQITQGEADMGVAVIIFTIVFRILWTPISLASGRTYKERVAMTEKIAKLELQYSHDPIKQKEAVKQIFRGNTRIVLSSFATIMLQTLIALMLWRIFAKGLKGEDLHLLYSWMPHQTGDYNLMFLGKYDLTRPNWMLNFLQSFVIFLVEALSALFSQEAKYRREVIMAQFVLPVVSFLIFMTLPAGKKLFIITTLTYSIGLILVNQTIYLFNHFGKKMDDMAMKAVERKLAEEAEVSGVSKSDGDSSKANRIAKEDQKTSHS